MSSAKKHKLLKLLHRQLATIVAGIAILLSASTLVFCTSSVFADTSSSGTTPVNCPSGETDIAGACAQALKTGDSNTAQYHCGGGDDEVDTSIDFGCTGKGTALTDALFAIIRFLSIGVGLVIVASMIWAGIQYTTSHDDPAAVGKAKERVMNNIIALLVYIFAYAILNYLIPKGFFG